MAIQIYLLTVMHSPAGHTMILDAVILYAYFIYL